MANRFPLIVNANTDQIQELPVGDNLDLSSSGISSVGNIYSTGIITASSFSGSFSGTSTLASGLTGSPSITVSGLYATGIATFEQNINLRDNAKANFGNDTDLRIYHDGTNSYVEDTGTGNLYLSGSTDVIIQHHSTSETMAKFTGNGAAELYYDNSKKFETTSGGVSVTGSITASSATITGNVSIAGTLTYEDVTSIDAIGLVTARTGVRITTGGLVVTAGVSTFTTGPVIIGAATSTGTASQPLQVTGGAYVSGNLGIGTTNPTSQLQITGQFQSTQANSTADGGGQIYLNGANGNRIDFNSTGVAAPSFTTRSAGTKILLYGGLSPSTVDYAFGIESSTLWSSVASSAQQFKWYAGTTNIASLFGTGELVVGTTTKTGTASQPLQVSGGAYVSGALGIGTTNPAATGSTLGVAGTITELYAGQYWNVVSQADVGIGASQVPLNQYLGQLAFVDDFSPTTLIAPRLQSVGEKTTLVAGNTVSLTYNTGGGNIAICTNPSGDITLAVAGIPTDSTFDNTALTFSVFVNQTGTARSCTAVTLNGLTASIKWAGGSLASALSGVTTTSGTDIYSFTGINTIGSASTTANYRVLGVVNGGFR
jgi:hypothetical protein